MKVVVDTNVFVSGVFFGGKPRTKVMASRDPDDDKFIECALDSGALYIISGDKDLLVLEKFRGVTMITAADFVARYLTATNQPCIDS